MPKADKGASKSRFFGLMRRADRIVIAALCFLALSCVTNGRTSASSSVLKEDASIVSGRLPSGVSYSFKENPDPRHRIFLRLVVDAGSLDENENELGAAHFVEHMAFRGGRLFPDDGLVRYMESLGMTVGAEVNASTGYEATVFRLEVPSDDAAAVQNGFLVLRDWAEGLQFLPEAVDKERHVVLEELQHARGPGDRIWQRELNAVYGNSRYARAVPIGRPEVVQALTPEDLRRFYNRWYAPARMRVICAGDLPIIAMQAAFISAFGDIKGRSGPAQVPRSVPLSPGLHVSVAADPELETSSVLLGARIGWSDEDNLSVEGFRQKAERALWLDLLRNRFVEVIRRSSDTNLTSVIFDEARLASDYYVITVKANFRGADWRSPVRTVLEELSRAARWGFSQDEIARVESGYHADFAAWRANGIASRNWADRLETAYAEGVVPISIDERTRLYEQVFSDFLNAKASRSIMPFLKARERLVLLALLDTGITLPSEGDVTEAFTESLRDLGPWSAKVNYGGVITALPLPSSPISERNDAFLGLTDLQYGNGLRVILRPTTLKTDEVALYGIALRGTDNLSLEGCANMSLASSLIPSSGFAGFPAERLKSILAGKRVTLSIGAEEGDSFIHGFSAAESVELLLQLVHRTMTDPVVDEIGFRSLRQSTAQYGRQFGSQPRRLLQLEAMKQLFPQDDRKILFSKEEDAQLLGVEAMKRSFLALFGSPSGFTFCITGSFKTEAVRALCDRYLGSLPATDLKLEAHRSQIVSSGPYSKMLHMGKGDGAYVTLVYAEPRADTDPMTVDGLAALAELLTRELRRALRVSAGGTYDPDASSIVNTAQGYALMDVSFAASESRAQELTALAQNAIVRIDHDGVDKAMLRDVVLALTREIEDASESNGYLARRTAWCAAHNEGLDPVRDNLARLRALTPEWMNAAARRYLDPNNLSVFTLLPANGQ